MKDVEKAKQSNAANMLLDLDDVSMSTFAERIDILCKQYGLHGQIIERRPYPASNKTEKYIYIGFEPKPADTDVTEIAARPKRNTKVFFPKQYAIKLDCENESKLLFEIQSAMDYCRDAEFVRNIYFEYGTPVPDRILGTDFQRLVELSRVLNTTDLDISGKLIYLKSLARFFKRERTKNPFLKKWLEYRRSDRFLYGGSIFAHLKRLFSKKRNIHLDALQNNCLSVSNAVLPAHRLKDFVNYMDQNYPEVCYSIGPKCVTDYGILSDKQKAAFTTFGTVNPYGNTVSYETFCRVLDEKFQSEGYEAIKNLNPSKWEMHSLSYSLADEPFIAKAFYNIAYKFAKKDNFQYIKDRVSYRGEDLAVEIPSDDLLNFISLANANGLHYFFDNYGYYGIPNLDTVFVAYNANDQKLVDGILNRMVRDRAKNGHLATRVQAPRIEKLNQKIQNAQKNCNLGKNKSKEIIIPER